MMNLANVYERQRRELVKNNGGSKGCPERGAGSAKCRSANVWGDWGLGGCTPAHRKFFLNLTFKSVLVYLAG